MSIASEISRITSFRNRIRTKLINLGIMIPELPAGGGTGNRSTEPTNDLSDCTKAIEDIDEVNPIMLSTTNVTNVAAYKYAQVDATAFQPSGPLPSDLCSKVAYLGANGIESTSPTNYASLGDVTPPQGYNGMRVVTLKIDTDVIKDENIRSGVSILGVQGNYVGSLGIADLRSTGAPSGWNEERPAISIDLDELIPNFSRSNILSISGYNNSMEEHALLNFNDKIASFYIVGNSNPIGTAILVQSNGSWLDPTSIGFTITASEVVQGHTRVIISTTNNTNKFKGVYMVSIVYTK